MLPSDEIRTIVKDISSNNTFGNTEQKKEFYGKKYETFKKEYPKLFDMCCEPGGCNIEKLEFMLDMLSKVKSNKMNQDKASEIIGQQLFDEYVKPVINTDKK